MRRRLLGLAVLAALLCLAPPAARARQEGGPKILADQIYGRKDGMALTLDVIQPAKANGAGIVWIPTGGWYSRWADPKLWAGLSKGFLDKGYTMFMVYHGSAPKYTVPEAVEDVRRCVRFIRSRAKEFGVDPERLGATGASAGGHLTLMLATTGDDGNPRSKDEVLRHSSRIAAGVALCPPTDIREWPTNPPEAIKRIPTLKPPLSFDPKKGRDVSPELLVTEKTAPVLLIHGDEDELVPIEHSKKMIAALKKHKVTSELMELEGVGHNVFTQAKKIGPAQLAWFEKHLAAAKKKEKKDE